MKSTTQSPTRIVLFLLLAILIFACSPHATPGPPLEFQPEKLPAGKVGVVYRIEIIAANAGTPVYDWSIIDGLLPAGIKLVDTEKSESVLLEGTPEKSGTFVFTIRAMCLGTSVNGQTGAKEYTLVIEK